MSIFTHRLVPISSTPTPRPNGPIQTAEINPLAHWLHREGYSMEIPLLRGHGTRVEDREPVAAGLEALRDWDVQPTKRP
ncbi:MULTISPECIES: hypothetical protein [Aphanothece]|uniref:hypothetical protein n=1 Tax=Aphanothece TaxID=1121 RepID=UPI0039855AA0